MSHAVTVVISDLHLGGGAADPGDDHVYDKQQVVRFLQRLSGMTTAPVELVINGDFLEFSQVAPEAYRRRSARWWCSEKESLEKLEVIIAGHADIFDALRRFKASSRTVTLVPGNHDVDLYWPRVQDRLKKEAQVRFDVGQVTLKRHDGRLLIEHGHMEDPANRFRNWPSPFVKGPKNEDRLEMCPGTLFMVKFINDLEREYPFADNIKPIMAFVRFLLEEGRARYMPVVWTLLRFAARHPSSTLGRRRPGQSPPDLRSLVAKAFDVNFKFRAQFVALHKTVGGGREARAARARFTSDEALAEFIELLALQLPSKRWLAVFELAMPRTLGVVHSGARHEKELLAKRAVELLKTGADVVVFGHTHQPDRWETKGKAYFNPGSWTRYLELKRMKGLKMADLRDESKFPYALNYVWVEETDSGMLGARMDCFEQGGAGTSSSAPTGPPSRAAGRTSLAHRKD